MVLTNVMSCFYPKKGAKRGPIGQIKLKYLFHSFRRFFLKLNVYFMKIVGEKAQNYSLIDFPHVDAS